MKTGGLESGRKGSRSQGAAAKAWSVEQGPASEVSGIMHSSFP